MLQIRVLHVGKPTRSNALASCRVELVSEDGKDVVLVCDARILRNKFGELWVGFHTQAITDSERKTSYIPTIEFSANLRARISNAVLKNYWSAQNSVPRGGNPSSVSLADMVGEKP